MNHLETIAELKTKVEILESDVHNKANRIEELENEVLQLEGDIEPFNEILEEKGYFISSDNLATEYNIEAFIKTLYPNANDESKWSKIG